MKRAKRTALVLLNFDGVVTGYSDGYELDSDELKIRNNLGDYNYSDATRIAIVYTSLVKVDRVTSRATLTIV